ncbi:hypothetical protein MXB_4820, partial [Myxobolus squamalis]
MQNDDGIDQPLKTLIKRFEQTKQIYSNIHKGTRFLFHLSKPKSSIFSISFDDRYYNETRVEWLKKLSVDISDEFTDPIGLSFNLLKNYYQAEKENRKIIENSLCSTILPKINEMSTPDNQEIVKHQHSVLMEYVMSIRDYHKNLYEILENCCKNMKENDVKINERKLSKLKNSDLILQENPKLSYYNTLKSQIREREPFTKKMDKNLNHTKKMYFNLYKFLNCCINLLPGTIVIAKFEMKCEREEDLEFKKGDIIN